MAWLILFLAGLCEVVWAYALKESRGFSRLAPTALFVVSLAASMGLLAWSLRSLPLSLAYPIWTGIGAVGSVVVGVLLFSETLSPMKLVFLFLLVSGIIGLKTVN